MESGSFSIDPVLHKFSWFPLRPAPVIEPSDYGVQLLTLALDLSQFLVLLVFYIFHTFFPH